MPNYHPHFRAQRSVIDPSITRYRREMIFLNSMQLQSNGNRQAVTYLNH